jgi:SSS family transporter
VRLGALDLAIVVVYLAGVAALGSWFRRRQRNLRDYFLGGRQTPTWALVLSIVATETSTLTIIGTPALAYASNLAFLQLVFGYVVARFVISFLLLPAYFRGELFTAYQYIEQRFGRETRRLAAGLFLVTRALAEGVRVFATSLVVSAALGADTFTALLVLTLVTLFYTFQGGMQAVIWTDVAQFFLYLAGGLIVFWKALALVPGGWAQVETFAGAKLVVFDFRWAADLEYTFWSGLLGGAFLTLASHGTDQLLVQRLLAARSLRQSQTALIASGFVVLFQFALFLLIGAVLYVFYQWSPPAAPFAKADEILPTFVVANLPTGLAGLFVAAVLAAAMSTSSATLNSLAASTVIDFGRAGREASLERSRWMTVAWGAVMIALGWWAQHWGPVLEAGLSIASVTYGAMLGLFLLGRLAPSATATGATVGMAAGLATVLAVRLATPIAWTWYVFLGAMTTFLVGWLASRLLPTRAEAAA